MYTHTSLATSAVGNQPGMSCSERTGFTEPTKCYTLVWFAFYRVTNYTLDFVAGFLGFWFRFCLFVCFCFLTVSGSVSERGIATERNT